MKTGATTRLAFIVVASACGSSANLVGTASTAVSTTTAPTTTVVPTTVAPTTTVVPTTVTPTTTVVTTTTVELSSTAPPPTFQPWTSESTWDMCLVRGPDGRQYEWLNHATWMSLERQRRELPNSVILDGGGATTASATPGEAGEPEDLIDDFVEERCDLIVTIGAEMGAATAASADQNPDVDFIGIDQHHDGELLNLASLVFPEDRAGFLVGALAASATENGTVAVVLDSITEPSSVAYRTGFANGVAYVDPNVEVLSVAHPGGAEEPDAGWGATAATQALDGGADVIFAPGSGSGYGVLVETAGTGYDARNGALCIGAGVDDFLQVIKARRCMLTSVHKLPDEFHEFYWRPGRPAYIKQYEEALDLPFEYEVGYAHSTLSLINREFLLGGTPSGVHLGPVGLHFFNAWGAHKTGVPNRAYWPSDELKSLLADLTGALWRGEINAS